MKANTRQFTNAIAISTRGIKYTITEIWLDQNKDVSWYVGWRILDSGIKAKRTLRPAEIQLYMSLDKP